MEKRKCYASRFITDVCIDDNKITLLDSSRLEYIIDSANIACIEQFKKWFKNVFSKGIAQTCTIFQYEMVAISECEKELHIVKFITQD